MKKQVLICVLFTVCMGIVLLIAYFSDRSLEMPEASSTVSATDTVSDPPTDGETDPETILFGKTAVFLGDSICAGTSVGEDLPEYGYGWAGLIGEANDMIWANYGRNGGTVTPIQSVAAEKRDLFSQLEIARRAYTKVDYVLIEGGVNDADLLKDDPANLGTVSEGFADFDQSTFSGAFEKLIADIREAYPTAKIGYIIPPKMGNAPYDAEHNIRRRYFDRAIEICEKWGIAYIDLWADSPLDPMSAIYYDETLDAAANISTGKSYTDGQHLTGAGYKLIVPQIEAFMRNLQDE